MSEMLGNQYFMGRHYYEAKNEFEIELTKQPANLAVKKKLIICFTQTNQVEQAVNLFLDVIRQNIELIIDTDPVRDDCPCPELIEKISTPEKQFKNEFEENIVFGILWLYCDAENSLRFFKTAQELLPGDARVNIIINLLENYIHSDLTTKNIH